MKQITIKIDGERGSGKTTTAIRIANLLISMGHIVAYRGRSRACEKLIKNQFIKHQPLRKGDKPRRFLIEDISPRLTCE
jgi:ABC-type microcin C transport system duplicated ATPase subunit YejF